jgi:hypothetical protein
MSLCLDFTTQMTAGSLSTRLQLRLARRRSLQRAALRDGAYVLRNGRGYAVAAAAGVGLMLLAWSLFLYEARFLVAPDDLTQGIALSAIALFIAALFVLASFGIRVRLAPRDIERRILGITKRISWQDISSVTPTWVPYQIILRSRQGGSMALSFTMQGSGTLAEQILEHVPAAVLDLHPQVHAGLVRIRKNLAG